MSTYVSKRNGFPLLMKIVSVLHLIACIIISSAAVRRIAFDIAHGNYTTGFFGGTHGLVPFVFNLQFNLLCLFAVWLIGGCSLCAFMHLHAWLSGMDVYRPKHMPFHCTRHFSFWLFLAYSAVFFASGVFEISHVTGAFVSETVLSNIDIAVVIGVIFLPLLLVTLFAAGVVIAAGALLNVGGYFLLLHLFRYFMDYALSFDEDYVRLCRDIDRRDKELREYSECRHLDVFVSDDVLNSI